MSGSNLSTAGEGNHLNLSVGDLVEFSAKRGDLYHHQSGPTTAEGIQGHLKIQTSRGESWQKEVYLAQAITLADYTIKLQGRADLIYEDFVSTVVEEIKTTYHPADQLPEAKKSLHFAQARVYAYLYSLEHKNKNTLDVRVTWYDLRRKKTHSENEHTTVERLKAFTLELLECYVLWHAALEKHRQLARESCQRLRFPFQDFRPQQRKFSSLVYRSIREAEDLLIEAPTGSGKTLATLFPSIKAYGEHRITQICYLTLKNSAAAAAENTLALLNNEDLRITYTRVQARDKTCPCRQLNDNESFLNDEGICLRSIGYYDRLPAARVEALNKGRLDSQTIQEIASRHSICPFEFSLEMARWSAIVICDVNYFFDPMIRLSFFDTKADTRALLIDELHNLVDRGRDMYSAALDTFTLMQLKKTLPKESKRLREALTELIDCLKHLCNSDTTMESLPRAVTDALENVISARQQEEDVRPAAVDVASLSDIGKTMIDIYKFQVVAALFSKAHILIYTKKKNHAQLKLFCRDPSELLAKQRKGTCSSLGFSATLTPIDYIKSSLGFSQDTKAYSLPSAFPPERQLTLRCDFIDTRYRQRDTSLDQLNQLIYSMQAAKSGNYLVFLPSYAYLDALREKFSVRFPNINCIYQHRDSDESSRKTFIDAFMHPRQQSTQATLIGFAILGGIFAEGIDYIGESLSGAVVVGLGMPQPGQEQKLMEAFYRAQDKDAFHYVYQVPGITRVLQTSGRVIRSEHDKGLVILVDPRLKEPAFSALLPPHWHVEGLGSIAQLEARLAAFWQDS